MKKLLLLLIAILTMSFALTGCGEDVTPLSNVGGDVKSGNGTFAVEKGDYVYFVNGIGDMTQSNKMGEVVKGALVRVKTTDIGKEDAKIETVIPKFVNTSSAISGVYIYGDTVYYATPYDGKDKTGEVRRDYTDFRTFDLKTGKSTQILFESKTVNKYKYVSNSNGVFLMYDVTETVDEKEVKTFNVYKTNGDKVFSVDGYGELLMADDNSDKAFYTKTAYSEELEQDENFTEVYMYTAGASQAEVVFSGCGENAKLRDGRNSADYTAKILKYSDLSGVKVTLIKNTGKILVMKVTSNDANLSAYYFGLTIADGVKVSSLKELGVSDEYLDAAITANSYYKSLNEIYYIENTTNLKGLVKFNYENLSDVYHGRTQISDDANGYNIAFEQDGYLYISGTANDYYRIKLDGANKLKKINSANVNSLTSWFVPRVIGNKFICTYSDSLFQSYVFAIDIENADNDDYQDYIDEYATLDREKVLNLNKTLLGIKNDPDKTFFETLLDSTYPEDDED
ncbi:MAG: hypothetical protein IKA54_03640 [Clostridia bacterium]|nr:hypothetical protein [Clostridia bacterium]